MRHLKNLFKRKSVPTLLLDSDDLGQTPRKQEPRPQPQKTAHTAVPRPDAVPPSPHEMLSIDCPDPTAETVFAMKTTSWAKAWCGKRTGRRCQR